MYTKSPLQRASEIQGWLRRAPKVFFPPRTTARESECGLKTRRLGKKRPTKRNIVAAAQFAALEKRGADPGRGVAGRE